MATIWIELDGKKQKIPGSNWASWKRRGAKRCKPPNLERAVKPEGERAIYPKHVGGGWYELPDGSRVQGKEDAEQAIAETGE